MIDTTVCGIPCKVQLDYYTPGRDMLITGMGFGDCEPPEPEEVLFSVYDRKGYPAAWLENKLTDSECERIEEELVECMKADNFDPPDY